MKSDWSSKLKRALAAEPGPAPTGRVSSVLIAIGLNSATHQEEILLTKRTMLVESHKGQVSFPGGHWENHDATLVHTALRESQEEIGTAAGDIEILGLLDKVKTFQGVDIFPWVARMAFPYPFQLNPHEVERVLFLPVQRLLEEGLQHRAIEVGTHRVVSPAIDVDGETVWGATARMLEQLRMHLINIK